MLIFSTGYRVYIQVHVCFTAPQLYLTDSAEFIDRDERSRNVLLSVQIKQTFPKDFFFECMTVR